jgi:hypothetical protein
MNGCWKQLYPELAAGFDGSEKILGAATGKLVQLMNEVSTEDVDELIASHSEPIPVKILLSCNRQIRLHLTTKMMTKSFKVLPKRLRLRRTSMQSSFTFRSY